MSGVPPSLRPDGGGRRTSQTPQQQQVHPNINPNFNLNTNLFLPHQNPNFLALLSPFYQNPLIFSQFQQQFPNCNFPVQLNTDYNNFQSQYPNVNNNSTFSPQRINVQIEMVEKLDKAALKARKDLLRLNVNVSAWKVSQAALLAVKAESWESLGLQLQQVPSLNDLLVTEGKINAFIHCFVAVRRITSLYDLEAAICESEGVKQFEELGLGPLVRHPLAVHYFSVPSNLTEVYRIRTEEIIDYLYEFTCTHKKKEIKVDTFLDFICKKQPVSFREVLCVRAENFGFYVNLIKQASQSEDNILENCYEKMRMTTGKRHKKRPLFSAQKKEMDENLISISQRMNSFSSVNTQFCGKHTRFMSSSSEDDSSEASDYEDIQDRKYTDSSCSLSQPNGRTEHVHSCPYPSETEELRRLGLKREAGSSSCTPDESVRCNIDNELSRRKRRHENMSSGAPLPRKLPKKDKFAADLKHKGTGDEGMDGHLLPIASLKMFVTTWKDACQGNSADKVRSEKLLADIGLKTQVTVDDALSVLRLWKGSASHFKASVSQMSNFYSFLWKGMAHSKKQVVEELLSGPFIFVPNTSIYSEEDALPGSLFSPQEVYWHDNIGSVDQMKSGHPGRVLRLASSPQRKMLHKFYPNLHEFFVNECGVVESPPLSSYFQFLLQLSGFALPHQAAKRVFEVFLIWDSALRSGSMSVEDVEYLKESLLKKEHTVLPTRQDKWVSLHSSFGLICWFDDDNLEREFRHLEGIDFLFFGESTGKENQMQVSAILQRLGIPALSEIVTREAIPYGQGDGTFFFSLVNWVLPYAQRYIHNAHPDKYFQLKQSGFDNITHMKIVVVEKLFYRNKVKKWEITSKKRHQCYCLLQESILYCSRESDPHSIFLELSRLLFDGTPELHFANFLHIITMMAKSGATEEQIDLFIVNSQKVPIPPSEEPIWSLQPVSLSMENNTPVLQIRHSLKIEEGNSSLDTGEPGNNSNWPPADWKTAPRLNPIRPYVFENPWPSLLQIIESSNAEQADISPPDNTDEFNNEVYSTAITQGPVLVEASIVASECNTPTNLMISSSMNIGLNSVNLTTPDMKNTGPSDSTERNQVSAQQALLTGRLGELVAFKYFEETAGECFVKWVNETNESGLPYDIVLEGDEKNDREYVEVKATRFGRKNWFLISMREWQFAVEKGESFSIAHVVLADDNMARVTIYKNPARLCQSGDLKLAIVVAKQ